jgi:chorismate synthase
MSSTYGESLKLSIFGQSHGPAIGMTLDGIPAGLPVDLEELQLFLNRRAPGQNEWSTPRKEEDRPEFLSGLVNGHTCGAPIAAIIRNTNTRSGDYDNLKHCPRPGHADYTAQIKYDGFQDAAGGGHFSGRLTAPLCVAGGLCKQWLQSMGIHVSAHITAIGPLAGRRFDPIHPEIESIGQIFPTLNLSDAENFQKIIQEAHTRRDSVGGKIECAVVGLPAGLGDPMFGGMENRISSIVYGIPALKSVSFGSTEAYGSQNNDVYVSENGIVKTLSNQCGGILGGITNGMPMIFEVGIKPTPSISMPQTTVDLRTFETTTLSVKGRHDPCIVPRAVPVVEAATAIAIYDAILSQPNRR